ncbi:MAG TPA: hypothetical protein PKH50_01890 [bacterium]|jgi:glutaredoxin|nr:hypothetical protein [bacterium]
MKFIKMTKIQKKKIKIIFASLIFGVFGLFSIPKSMAAEKVNLYLFWGEGCPHCAREKSFLTKLIKEDPDIVLHEFEIYKDTYGRARFVEATNKMNIEANGVPLLIIGDRYLVGYLDDETTGEEIRRLIEENRKNGCFDVFADEVFGVDKKIISSKTDTGSESLSSGGTSKISLETISSGSDSPSGVVNNGGNPAENTSKQENCELSTEPPKVILPKVGNLNMELLSLPALTVVLGLLDGFNPCAMWVLLFLISLLIGMKDKKKMWILGIAFIVSSALVYFLFMVAWLNFFKFVGFIMWVRVLISAIALIGGYSSLKKSFSEDSSGCDVSDDEKKEKVFRKIGKVVSNKSFFLALAGIIGLAFAVNLVELVCSAGLPAVYTQVLALNKMEGTEYYLYILLYILFFMLDDLFVFFVTMVTLQMTGITTKYVKYTRLIGGILLIIMGILLLFKPELLMFG